MPPHPSPAFRPVLLWGLLVASSALAAVLAVTATGIRRNKGKIGVACFTASTGVGLRGYPFRFEPRGDEAARDAFGHSPAHLTARRNNARLAVE